MKNCKEIPSTYNQRLAQICDFMREYSKEIAQDDATDNISESYPRIKEVLNELKDSASPNSDMLWNPTSEELLFAGKLAWRNSNRCIGRLHWKSLHLKDNRHVKDPSLVFDALLEHLRFATNGGKIRSVLTVFNNDVSIHNPQIIRYAGFTNSDGSITGDPLMVPFTKKLLHMGWIPKSRHEYVILPLLIETRDSGPVIFDLPDNPEYVLEVPILHPEYDFSGLGMKWHALPVISNMDLCFGGLRFSCAPFNGFYMGTEIGARNLGDIARYNKLPEVADAMNLSRSRNDSLWKDKALIELNVAVLHSFKTAGVKIVDHHTASDQFMLFNQLEKSQAREVTADWSWIVPPVSGSACPVFHHEMEDRTHFPNFLYRNQPYL
ncbi:MAG: nitric oxide synthase oxygenase [Balneolales bacterium]|nr:nitric oxide synthase oxygenase [Balneolales bacterium]